MPPYNGKEGGSETKSMEHRVILPALDTFGMLLITFLITVKVFKPSESECLPVIVKCAVEHGRSPRRHYVGRAHLLSSKTHVVILINKKLRCDYVQSNSFGRDLGVTLVVSQRKGQVALC